MLVPVICQLLLYVIFCYVSYCYILVTVVCQLLLYVSFFYVSYCYISVSVMSVTELCQYNCWKQAAAEKLRQCLGF
jgi:hypothetical protein